MSDNAPTEKIARKPILVSPESQVLIKTGSIVTGAGALVIATIFVWGIKTNSEQALQEIKALREEVIPAFKKIDRLWWDYESRTAGRPTNHQANP